MFDRVILADTQADATRFVIWLRVFQRPARQHKRGRGIDAAGRGLPASALGLPSEVD